VMIKVKRINCGGGDAGCSLFLFVYFFGVEFMCVCVSPNFFLPFDSVMTKVYIALNFRFSH
jgi:hypothetical protein